MSEPVPILRGTLDILVLKALNWGPMHGVQISDWLDRQGDGRLELLDSALYQALYRLEERGLIKGEWGTTDNNRRARYYSLTVAGRSHLEAERAKWLRYSDTVNAILLARSR
jgi:PadR family transcriptional regulator, regulatory protein PadR